MARTIARQQKTTKPQKKVPSRSFYDPFHTFREEMNDLVDRVFGHPMTLFEYPKFPGLSAGRGGAMLSPRTDVVENDKEVSLTAELPGIDEKDISLSIEQGVLTLKGEKRSEKDEKKDNRRVMERHYGRFQRSFTLPSSVDDSKIEAGFDKGVLTVTMPKHSGAEKESGRKIKIGKK